MIIKILGKLECFADDLYVLAGQPLMPLSWSYIYHIVYLCNCWYFSIKNECYRLVKISMRCVKEFDTVGIWQMVKLG